MSAIITKYYNQIFKPLVSENGFRKKKNLFHRLINKKIVQTICLNKSRFGHSFTINIGLFPMCIGIEDELLLQIGILRIGRLLKDYDYWWDYDLNGTMPEDILVNKAFIAVQEKVLPLFEKIIDEEAFLSNVNKIEKEIYGLPIENSSLKLWVNLKIKNYKNVLLIIEKIELQNYSAAAANKSLFEKEEDYKVYLQKIENDLSELRDIKAAIQKNDTSFLETLLIRNEEISKKTLEKLGYKFQF